MRFAATCLLALGLALAVAACGQDHGSKEVASGSAAQEPAAGQAGSGSQTGSGSAAAPAAGSGGGMATAQPSATATSCLDLVAAAQFAEAIDPCTRAVREAPQNTALAEALRKAQAGVAASAAKASDTAAAAAAQAGAAQQSASDTMKEAAGALPK